MHGRSARSDRWKRLAAAAPRTRNTNPSFLSPLPMPKPVILLSIPALREKDVAVMPKLRNLTAGGEIAELTPSFPCVTCPVQANMTTGKRPAEHGVVANGFYWRDRRQVEMWTAPNDCIEQPQIWDLLSHHCGGLSSAVWFPMHSKGCEADYVCTPAPIHNPDGSESLWCYTRPMELYGQLRDELGHFPLMNYWGPLTNVKATAWIADSAVIAARQWQPDFFYIYLPHLDYAAQRTGPDSAAADVAVAELDEVIGQLAAGMAEAYDEELLWLVAGEYAITPVDHVAYPNRVLREAGLLAVREADDGEHLDLQQSRAFALVDHQFSHVFVADGDPQLAARVAELFRGQPGIAEVLVGRRAKPLSTGTSAERRGDLDLHAAKLAGVLLVACRRSGAAVRPHGRHSPQAGLRSGGIVLRSGDARAFRWTPGASKARTGPRRRTVRSGACCWLREPTLFPGPAVSDADVFGVVLRHFGLQ